MQKAVEEREEHRSGRDAVELDKNQMSYSLVHGTWIYILVFSFVLPFFLITLEKDHFQRIYCQRTYTSKQMSILACYHLFVPGDCSKAEQIIQPSGQSQCLGWTINSDNVEFGDKLVKTIAPYPGFPLSPEALVYESGLLPTVYGFYSRFSLKLYNHSSVLIWLDRNENA